MLSFLQHFQLFHVYITIPIHTYFEKNLVNYNEEKCTTPFYNHSFNALDRMPRKYKS